MLIINKEHVEEIINNPLYKRAKAHLLSWIKEVENADWNTPNEVKALYRSASILKKRRVIFNISGNNYRLVVDIDYSFKLVNIIWFGTHVEYDQEDAGAL